jgi:hypothetical protein
MVMGVVIAAARMSELMKRLVKRIFFSSTLALRYQGWFGRRAGNFVWASVKLSVVQDFDIGGDIMKEGESGVCALLHVFARLKRHVCLRAR